MSESNDPIESLLRRHAREHYPVAPDLRAAIVARLDARSFPRWGRFASAALVLLLCGVGVQQYRGRSRAEQARQPRFESPASLLAALTRDTLRSVSLPDLQGLARGTERFLEQELENPVRAELAAFASDARNTAQGLLEPLARPLARAAGR